LDLIVQAPSLHKDFINRFSIWLKKLLIV
jgi:hypothetical protein